MNFKLENLKFLMNVLCSQNVKKYKKHKHTFSGMPPPITWQLTYKPFDFEESNHMIICFWNTKVFWRILLWMQQQAPKRLYIQMKSFSRVPILIKF